MTKYFNAKVEVVQTKTIHVQVAADSEADAIKQAEEKAEVKELGFYARDVQLTFVGESEMEVGDRVVHSIFGAGALEALFPNGPGSGFRVRVKFDRGGTKEIHGPSGVLRPESLANG